MRRVTRLALVLAGALAAGSCDKVPLLAPSGSTVTLSANATTIPTGGTVGLTAFVTESNGSAVQNGTTVRFGTTLGSVSPVSAQTTNGLAVATFNAGDQSGIATVTAVSGGATGTSTGGTGGTTTATNSVKITVGTAAVTKITVSASPSTVGPNGGTTTVTASALDTNGAPLPGIPITFSTDKGTVIPSVVSTDSSGHASATLTTSEAATVTAASGTQSATVAVAIRSGPGITISCAVASAGSGTSCASVQANANTNNVTLTFTVSKGTGSSNLTGSTVNFGDGTSQSLGNLAGGSTTVSHVYAGPSSGNVAGYTAVATATDVNGETSAASTTVTVTQRGTYSVDLAVSPGDSSSHPVTESFTATVNNGDASKFTWDFGDGSSTVETNSNKTTHVYSAAGSYTATVTAQATDGRSGTGRVEFTIK